jgi:hypothetical protein
MRLGCVLRSALVALGLLLALGVGYRWGAHQPPFARGGPLEGRIVDDATGEPLAARIALTDENGRPLEIDGKHQHVQQLGKRWCYVDGTFSVSLPPSGATVEIRRGLETRPLSEEVSGGAVGKPAVRTFRLRRFADMSAGGYASGDLHAHIPALADALLEMRAEDLNALNLVILGGLPLPNDGSFEGRIDERSTPGHEVYVSQEIIDWHLGHLTLAGLKSLVPGYPVPGGTLEYWTSHPHCDILRGARATREQGGLVSVAHFENLPGAETPVALALGLLDAIELPTWSDPMQLPAHLTPWDQSGMPASEFAPMRGADVYYQLLSAGFRLPIAAGTDKSGEDIPVGSNRAYVRVKGKAGYAAWLDGIRSGEGFVTNGPLLELEVDGHGAGEVVPFEGTRSVKVRAAARSILPFTTLEVLANGQPVAHKLSLVQNNPPVDGVYAMEVEATVSLGRSTWLAARAFSNPDITPRLLPRESSVFSHTSPVYFLHDGRPVREEASVVYLRRYVKGLLHWLSTRPEFADEADRAAVQRDAEEARRILDAL